MPSWLPEEFSPNAPYELKKQFWEASVGPDARESQEVIDWKNELDTDEMILQINPARRVDMMVKHVLSSKAVEESEHNPEISNMGYAYRAKDGTATHIIPAEEVPIRGGADKTYLLQAVNVSESEVPSEFDSIGENWVMMRDNYWDKMLDYSNGFETDTALDTAVSEFASGKAYNRVFGYTEKRGLIDRIREKIPEFH